MELKEFVRNTITDIVQGVAEAQHEAKENQAEVGSQRLIGSLSSHAQAGTQIVQGGRQVTFIEFDVALSKSESSGSKSGIAVLFANIGLGANAQSESDASIVNRVKFSVPVLLPDAESDGTLDVEVTTL